MNTTTLSKQKTIPSLNGLRAISILLVILGHEFYHHYGWINWVPVIDGQLGVTVFFLLSGFLITWLLLKEEKAYGKVSMRNFFVRRTLRIFPAYFFLLAVYAGLQLAHLISLSAQSWLLSLTYTKYFNWELDWPTSHLWSLSVEEHFYILWIIAFKWFRKYRTYLAWALVVLTPLVRIFDYMSSSVRLTDLHFLTRADALMWGCLLAIYYQPVRQKLVQWAQRMPWLTVVPALFIILSSYLTEINANLHLHLGTLIIGFGGLTGTLTCLSILALVVFSVELKNRWSRFLNLPIMDFIGKLSYSLYLWQQIFFLDAIRDRLSFPLRLVLIVLAALFSYHLIEKPFLKLKSNFKQRNKPDAEEPGSEEPQVTLIPVSQ